MRQVAAECPSCDTRVEGRFELSNEFASLSDDDLHFLRVFVQCEGSIREMEAALGVSYPTVKARLAALKLKLATPQPAAQSQSPVDETLASIVAELQAGRISPTQAAERIRAARHQS